MCPVAHSDRHDAPRLFDELIPGLAAVVEDCVVGLEHAIGEPIVAHELPDVLDRVEFRALWWQRQDRDVRWHHEHVGKMPACLIHQQHGVRTGCDGLGDLGQMQAHRRGGAAWQDKRCPFPESGTDRTEDIGRGRALILRCGWPGAAPGPAPCDLVLLTNSGLVGEPDLYGCALDTRLARDLIQRSGEVFLKSAMAPAAWA